MKRYFAIYRETLDEYSADYGSPKCLLGAEMTREELPAQYRAALFGCARSDAVYVLDETDPENVKNVPRDWYVKELVK